MRFITTLTNLQLDVVGFLAILGEGSVQSNAQVASLSKWVLLPRLLPAPQALIRTARPDRLNQANAKAIGISSGNVRSPINYIPALLHDGDKLAPYSVQCMSVRKRWPDGDGDDDDGGHKSTPRARAFGPLAWLSLLGTAMAVSILALSIYYADGMALLATIFLSLVSTLTGVSSHWHLALPHRNVSATPQTQTQTQTQTPTLPPGDTILIYPHGAIQITYLLEPLARELHWAPESCIYDMILSTKAYRLVALLSTLLLMLGVIFLANSTLDLQIAFAVSYMILSALYWVVAALPDHVHWDLEDAYVVEPWMGTRENRTFTEALWMAIAITRSVEWVKIGGVTPQTRAWDRWLVEAEERANRSGNGKGDTTDTWTLPEWDCQQALMELLDPANKEGVLSQG